MFERFPIPKTIKHIHMIAICGTGMGSLAGLLKSKGYHVTGSDENIYPPMSTQLQESNIPIFKGFKAEHLTPRPDCVIIGNAISKNNPEAVATLQEKIPYLSMPEALSQFFIEDRKSIVITGTHGKTTTSALISHILLYLKQDPSYLVGGVFQDGRSSFKASNGDKIVLEGDEYDTAFFDKEPKFLHYKPFYTLISSIEFDHADIYQNIDHIVSSFQKLINKINPKGFLLYCNDYKSTQNLKLRNDLKTETYGVNSKADWSLDNFYYEEQKSHFDIYYQKKKILHLESPLLGKHNALNTLAAYVLLQKNGITADEFQKALLAFSGVKRRQEVRAEINSCIVMDDFAHHPTAISETIEAVKKAYTNHKLIAIFEPRSNTSKTDRFQTEFVESFKEADEIIIADVFRPDKIKEANCLDTKKLAHDIKQTYGKEAYALSGRESILKKLTENELQNKLFLIMSNGAFDGLHEALIEKLRNFFKTDYR